MKRKISIFAVLMMVMTILPSSVFAVEHQGGLSGNGEVQTATFGWVNPLYDDIQADHDDNSGVTDPDSGIAVAAYDIVYHTTYEAAGEAVLVRRKN